LEFGAWNLGFDTVMDSLTALILGIIQGLTEFLPVSSSGHLELGKAIFGVEAESSMTFTIVVHGATVLSTIVVFYKDIGRLFKGSLEFKWNDENRYLTKILISMIPVIFIGVFLKEEVKGFFTGNIVFVGSMLIITAVLLGLTQMIKSGNKKIPFSNAFLIGIAQALAVLPGISRSGATISTGLLLKNSRDEVTRFSFLMVLIPIIGANLMDILSGDMANETSVGIAPLIIGFIAAFISGLIACKWMLRIVRKGKLIWFALYCLVVGILAIVFGNL